MERKTELPEEYLRQYYPLKRIKEGFYSDKYFVRARDILIKDGINPRVVMQVFAKKRGFICGLKEVVLILKECCDSPEFLSIRAIPEGTWFRPWDTVMTIEGPYRSFAHLETVYLGILARRTGVATAVRKATDAANGIPILFFPARFDHPLNQEGDGYAASVGGVSGVSTDANGFWIGQEGNGTVPHSLIASYGGDTVKASLAFDSFVPEGVERIVLVDFNNDSPATSVAVARALGARLGGVRLDTSENMVDESLARKNITAKGVCPELVYEVRHALDREGFKNVKIIVSGGFNVSRIRRFVKENVPCDAFGIGSNFFHRRIDFTADIVMLNGKPLAKMGRSIRPNHNLIEYR